MHPCRTAHGGSDVRTLGTTVACSLCGKHLRGVEGLHGIHVSKHKDNETGKPCWGARRTNHRAVPKPSTSDNTDGPS